MLQRNTNVGLIVGGALGGCISLFIIVIIVVVVVITVQRCRDGIGKSVILRIVVGVPNIVMSIVLLLT